jgi:hypothetical protein
MLSMLALMWQAIGGNKLLPYIVVVLILMVILCTVYLQGRTAGTTGEKTKRLGDSLNRLHKEAQDRARIESMSSSAAREQLRKRWKQH